MNKYTQQLQKELNSCGKEPEFEIEVLDKQGEQDFISCEIYFRGNSIIAERVAVSEREEKSEFVACDKLKVDEAFSLDEHLQELFDIVIDSINQGGLFSVV